MCPSGPCRRASGPWPYILSLLRGHDPPDDVADIVGGEQRAVLCDLHADGAAIGLVVGAEKAAEDFARRSRRHAVGERHKDHAIAGARFAVPRTVLADKGAVLEAFGKQR